MGEQAKFVRDAFVSRSTTDKHIEVSYDLVHIHQLCSFIGIFCRIKHIPAVIRTRANLQLILKELGRVI